MTSADPNYVRRLERLLEASRLLNSTLELGELTEIVLRIVQDEVPVDRCTLYVLDRRQKMLRSFVAQGIDESEITLAIGQGLAGTVAQTGQALDVDDAYEDERFRPAYDNRLGYRTKDVYAMPIFNRGGNLIGVLQLLNRRQPLDDGDKGFLSSICTYIGLALQNAWVHRELNEARKFEQELTIVRTRLAEAEKRSELSELVTGIIHEMRNPLSVAVGQSNLLREQPDLPAGLISRVLKIEESIMRAVKIAQNFLNFARQGESDAVPSDINSVITQTVDLVSYDLRLSSIKVVMDLENLPLVTVDPGGIQQVLLNLLRNAQHALCNEQRAGTLTVRSIYDRSRSTVRIEMTDDGPGIPESAQGRVFEPFFTTKGKGIGTGLGLTVSKRIMEQHQGTLSFQSTPGVGTTFTLELPVLPAGERLARAN
jgi:signal transduction histidine kinase